MSTINIMSRFDKSILLYDSLANVFSPDEKINCLYGFFDESGHKNDNGMDIVGVFSDEPILAEEKKIKSPEEYVSFICYSRISEDNFLSPRYAKMNEREIESKIISEICKKFHPEEVYIDSYNGSEELEGELKFLMEQGKKGYYPKLEVKKHADGIFPGVKLADEYAGKFHNDVKNNRNDFF